MNDQDRRFLNRLAWGMWLVSGAFISWALELTWPRYLAFVFGLGLAVLALQTWWEIDE